MKKFLTFAALLSLPFLMGAGTVVKTLNPGGQLGPNVVDLPKIDMTYYTGTSGCPTNSGGVGNPPCTTVVNRAKVTNFAADLMPKFGVDRIMTQQIMKIEGETGPNGEPVFKPVNDIHDQVRFVGSWSSGLDATGARVQFGGTTSDFVEISFYGTGINILEVAYTSQVQSYSVDGASASQFLNGTFSSILAGRNTAPNQLIPVVSGLSLGMHTVKITSGGSGFQVYGFEIINASSPTNITLSPGTSYANGQKLTKSASSTTAYNSGFESGTLGTRGGHVLVYQKSDGSVAKSVTPTDAAAAYLTNANHANEEIVRTHNWREFGAGRADDWSLGTGSAVTSRAFTLDDGTTTLVTDGAYIFTPSGYPESMGPNNNGQFITLTFVGTGIDLFQTNPSAAVNATISIDGTAIATNVAGLTTFPVGKQTKVASGLAYGTHTLKIANTTQAGSLAFSQFIIYAPKTPTLPTGAVALADYFVMGDFNANTTAGVERISDGVLRKTTYREAVYVEGTGGTVNWSANSPTASLVGMQGTNTDRQNAYLEYSFFGTGFDLRFSVNSANRTTSVAVSLASNGGSLLTLNGTNYASAVCTTTNGASFSAGVLNQAVSSVDGAGFACKSLPLAAYKIRFLNNTAAKYLVAEAFDIITPIHAPKLNGPFVVQNTLSIGSQSVRDLRQFSVAQGGQQKMVAQAQGVTPSGVTTSALTPGVPCADASVSIKTTGNPIQISYKLAASNGLSPQAVFAVAVVDGVSVGQVSVFSAPAAGSVETLADTVVVPVAAGFHKVDLYWYVGANTATAYLTARILNVRELGN